MGDVVVLGYLTYLEVWELDVFQGQQACRSLHGRRRGGDFEAGNLESSE